MATLNPTHGTTTTNTVYTDGYIGTETFLLDREIHNKIFDRYRENEGLTDFLLNTGRVQTSANTTFHHWEHDYLINSAIVESSVLSNGTGTNDVATVTIEEVSHQETGTKSPFIVGDLVLIAGLRGRVMAVNKSVDDAHVYTINTLDAATWVGVVITARINKYGNAHADGTQGPASVSRKPIKQEGFTQIFKNMYEAHGSESANKSEVWVKGRPYFYLQGIVDASNIHMLDIENSMFFGLGGKTLVDATAPDEAGKIFTTEGLDRSVAARGINTTLGGAIAYSDLEDIVKALSIERAEKQYMGCFSTNLYLDFDSALHTRNTDTTINYAMFGKGDNKQSAIDFDYKSYSLGGYNMHMKQSDTLNYEPVVGGTSFNDTGYFIPMYTFRDAKDKLGMPTITLMTKKSDKSSRWMNEYTRGQKETGKDATEYHLQCEGGIRFAKVNAYVKIEQ